MIKVQGVNKSFGDFQALRDLEINVPKGSIYGLVGINGSGKTTIIKHITDVLRADSGEILVDGQSVKDNEEIKARIGYIPDDLYFFGSYTLAEMAKFMASTHPKTWNAERYSAMVKQFGLKESGRLAKFSKGMQKQAAFALVMSCMPDYLILDEPVDGLDPLVRRIVWKYVIDDVAAREMTVLVSSHNLRELEGMCDSIGILNAGHMVAERLQCDMSNESLEEIFIEELGGENSEIQYLL